jgi:hypothetical protein
MNREAAQVRRFSQRDCWPISLSVNARRRSSGWSERCGRKHSKALPWLYRRCVDRLMLFSVRCEASVTTQPGGFVQKETAPGREGATRSRSPVACRSLGK